jgi:hypothetical protein
MTGIMLRNIVHFPFPTFHFEVVGGMGMGMGM